MEIVKGSLAHGLRPGSGSVRFTLCGERLHKHTGPQASGVGVDQGSESDVTCPRCRLEIRFQSGMSVDRGTLARMGLKGSWNRIDDGMEGGKEEYDPNVKVSDYIHSLPVVTGEEQVKALLMVAHAVEEGAITQEQGQSIIDRMFPAR